MLWIDALSSSLSTPTRKHRSTGSVLFCFVHRIYGFRRETRTHRRQAISDPSPSILREARRIESLYSDQDKTTALRQKYEVPLFFVFCVVLFSVSYGILWRSNCIVTA